MQSRRIFKVALPDRIPQKTSQNYFTDLTPSHSPKATNPSSSPPTPPPPPSPQHDPSYSASVYTTPVSPAHPKPTLPHSDYNHRPSTHQSRLLSYCPYSSACPRRCRTARNLALWDRGREIVSCRGECRGRGWGLCRWGRRCWCVGGSLGLCWCPRSRLW